MVTHVGGKTLKKHKTVQVPVKVAEAIRWSISNIRKELVDEDKDEGRLLPALNTTNESLLDLKIEEIAHLPYPRLLRGNINRRHHVRMGHELHDAEELRGTSVGELATLRCHSSATPSRVYDARD